MTRKNSAPDVCPACGTMVPAGSRSCPGCGADEKSGWDEGADYTGLDLPDAAFDYEEALRDEGLKPRANPKGVSLFWWAVGIALLALLGYLVITRNF